MSTKFEKWVEKVTADIAKEVKEEIATRIEIQYESVIQAFYDDYEPHSYERTFNTFYASSGYRNLYSEKNIHQVANDGDSQIFEIGIHVSSDNIDGNPYRQNKDLIFERTFEQGIHGITEGDNISSDINVKVFPNPMKPSPKTLMDEWFDEFRKDKKTMDNIFLDATKKAIARNNSK